MKLIVVDVGNTSTAVGLWSNGRVSHVSHIDGGGLEAMAAVERLSKLSPDGIAYLSVVPAGDKKWTTFKIVEKSKPLPNASEKACINLVFISADHSEKGVENSSPFKFKAAINYSATPIH